jgi:hypothetical protein
MLAFSEKLLSHDDLRVLILPTVCCTFHMPAFSEKLLSHDDLRVLTLPTVC